MKQRSCGGTRGLAAMSVLQKGAAVNEIQRGVVVALSQRGIERRRVREKT